LFETDPDGQFQGPGAALFAGIARAAVQHLFQLLASFFRERGAQPMGARRPFVEHSEALGIETVEHVMYGLVVAAQLERNREARSPRADAIKIWQRRNTKASDERNPFWMCCRSSSVNGRIKMEFLILWSRPHFLLPLVEMH